MVNEIKNSQQFEQEVLNSANPVFVDFWAEWCGPCRAVSPVVEELSGEYDGKVDFVKINVDENGDLAQKYNVFSIPTLAIFKNGEIVSQKTGAATKESFKTMIDSSLN
ncbi:MAG: thioredoxin [Nitrosopumilus sp.]|jgi:thioredoxin 1|nr:thioredoxin [Nitrosopumilus sp.]MDH3794241.1 thioredoxin [Nitrosopumilus sp.]MDH3854954.1 thioredoxin [Nitrosopumilus sp.]